MLSFLVENVVVFSLIPVFSTETGTISSYMFISHSLHVHIALKNQLQFICT
jgi:hypothetical protein